MDGQDGVGRKKKELLVLSFELIKILSKFIQKVLKMV